MASTKILITHGGALEAKYGPAVRRIWRAIDRLVAADAARGFATRLVCVDRAQDMAGFDCPPMGLPVDDPVHGPGGDQEGAKNAVDAIDAKLRPHYLVLLGGPDVFPLQWLRNTAGVFDEAACNGDEDPNVPSDLPYACETRFSREPEDFQGPTRVVGRLPDVPAASNPDLFVKIIDQAAAARPLKARDYAKWMGLSAKAWQDSTRATLAMIFGSARGLILSPPRTDRWARETLSPRLHYINCHGGNCYDAFLGDGPDGQVEALSSRTLRGKVSPGTVVAAECCYGAKVFSPRKSEGADRGQRLGMPLEYLRQGAYGFFGSTTIAYGPADHIDYADVVCRQFVREVLSGRSLGRAVLEARLAYVKRDPWHDPVKLKTLAQFNLLGDPSIHPVAPAQAERRKRRDAQEVHRELASQRARARATRRREGRQLHEARVTFRKLGVEQLPPDAERELMKMATDRGMRTKLVNLYQMSAKIEVAARGRGNAREIRSANRVVVLLDAIRRDQGLAEPGDDRENYRVPVYGGMVAYLDEMGRVVQTKHIESR
jgi:hypothetical protein